MRDRQAQAGQVERAARCGSRDSGTIRYAATAASSASGTSAQKTLPQ